MSKKRRNFSAEFKAKVVLEMLEEGKTVNEISSKYDILPRSVQIWKKQFLENAVLAFDKSAVVKEYKEEIANLKREKDATSKKLGEILVEKEWLLGKLRSLDLSTKKRMVKRDSEVQAKVITKELSLNKKLELLGISKTAYYYEPVKAFNIVRAKEFLDTIDELYTAFPYYGTRRMVKALKERNFEVGRKLVKKAYEFMGIRALYPKKKTTKSNKYHKKYPYLLNELKNEQQQVKIESPNQVWSGDITYIRLEKGYAYFAGIIDWHTKKILSWKLSSTMDVNLTTDVLKEALSKYPKPEIFNSDQGSQYQAKEHIEILTKNNIAISMNSKGRSIDNIAIERFFRTLKYENVYPSSYKTMKEARTGIKEYINTYNSRRFHSSINYKRPDEVYNEYINQTLQKVA